MANQSSQTPLLATAAALEKAGDWAQATSVRAQAVVPTLAMPPSQDRASLTQDPDNTLEALGEVHQPTKKRHDYLRHYWRHFRDLRLEAKSVVEIGLQTPKSISMWADFFPNARLYGIDIDPACKSFETDRISVFVGDQMDEAFLLNFIKETGGGFDVIIDDGLHTEYSILKSFSYLYSALSDHGVYAIEDIQKLPGIIAFLRVLMDGINYYPPDVLTAEWPGLRSFSDETPWLIRNTVGVSFYRFLAFIERGFNPEDNRFLIPLDQFRDRVFHAGQKFVTELEQKHGAQTRSQLEQNLPRRFHHLIDRLLTEKKPQ